MELLKIRWLVARTSKSAEMADLLQTVLGLRLVHRDPGMHGRDLREHLSD
jgi:hypothetical protein